MVGFGQPEFDVSAGRQDLGRPGLALVVLSVVEQRLDAVRAVLAGATVTDVDRIVSFAGWAYTTAATKPPAAGAGLRRTAGTLAGVGHRVRDPYGHVGQVRARRRSVEDAWRVETSGPAFQLR